MADFTDLGLKKEIIQALSNANFKKAFEVQEKVIPLILKNGNVVFTSKTGSGKTLAYTIPFLSKLNRKLDVQMMIVVPTRELCIQIGKEIEKICSYLNLNVGTLYGGRDIKGDYRTLNRKNQIIVGTPGRIIQHINEKRIRPGDINYLIYDESDQMFDNGFYSDCCYIKKRTSKNVQIVLSSATITDKVNDFIKKEMGNNSFVSIGFQIPENIVQEKRFVEISKKNDFLIGFIEKKGFRKVLIFCNTKKRSEEIKDFLIGNKLKAESLSSDLEQVERENILNLFKDGKIPILVATDIAARGLHIDKVDAVINYDVPTRDEFYIHRIGRTGRVDKKGYALSLVCPEDEDRFYNLEFEYDLKVKEI